MAAFARPIAPATHSPATPSESARPRSLPHGSCNFKTAGVGGQPSPCGCKRFWKQVGSQHAPSDDAVAFTCVCSHHACFHDDVEVGHHSNGRVETTPPIFRSALPLATPDNRTPVYLQLASSNGEVRYQLMAGTNPVSLQGLENGRKAGIFATTPRERSQNSHVDRPSSVVARFEQQAAQGIAHARDDATAAGAVRVSATSHPALMTGRYDSPSRSGHMQGVAGSNAMRPPSVAGLGLTWQGRTGEGPSSEQSPTPTVPDDPAEMAKLLSVFPRADSLPSTAAQSFLHRDSPHRDFIHQTWVSGVPTLPLTIPLTGQAPSGYEQILQSATEPDTPSLKATPDLTEVQAYLREAQSLAEIISQHATPSRDANEVFDTAQGIGQTTVQSDDVARGFPQQNGPDELSNALTRLPGILQSLLPRFGALLEHLDTYPSISTSHQALLQRVDALQNASFDHVSPEDFLNKFELLDARLLEMECKVKEHEEYHAALDDDQSSINAQRTRRSRALVADAGSSFGSGASNNSVTSSTLIQAAVDRLETESKLKDVEERLEILEATAPPSLARPWEIEVVLLPWGRLLKGLWTSLDDAESSVLASARASQEWNQANKHRSATQSFSSAQVGWSSQAIHDWADASDEWLSPRACGPTGMVYKRLRSRGFVKKISLTSSGAAHVQTTIAASFRPLLDQLEELNPELEELGVYEVGRTFDPGEHHPMTSFLGLREPLIPLRKVHKSSRLRFLAASELATSALWNTQFLSSGILMRAPGGQKRLFVTTRAAYHQRMDGHSHQDGWTWQKLRELPRVSTNESAEDGEQSHVGEADAKEPCWAYNENLDPPPTTQSSFSSDYSGRSSHVSENARESRHSDDADIDDPLFNIVHDSNRVSRRVAADAYHQRTSSVPLVLGHDIAQPLSKRRVISFEQVNTDTGPLHRPESRGLQLPSAISDAQELESDSPSKTHRAKRRRFTRTQSTDAVSDTTDQQFLSRSGLSSIGLVRNLSESLIGGQQHHLQVTPRWSREPPSPFVAGMDNSAAASEAGPSTGSLAGVAARYAAWEAGAGNGVDPIHGKDGPVQAYATPYSAGEGIAGYGGDTQADSDSLNMRYVRGVNDGHDDDDDWEGVDEEDGIHAKARDVEDESMSDGHGQASDEEGVQEEGDEDVDGGEGSEEDEV